MSATITPREIEAQTGFRIANSIIGRERYPIAPLDPSEEIAIETVVNSGLAHLARVAPEVYDAIVRPFPGAKLIELVKIFARIAKAQFPSQKPYTFPPEKGKLGIAWLFPQAIKWTTPSDTEPCYTSYIDNSWDIPITAGQPAYLFGSADKFYYTSKTPEKYSAILVLYNGIIEIGSTPSAQQFQLVSDTKNVAPYVVEPLIDVPLNAQKSIYLYPTPMGALFIDHMTGIKWSFMPTRSGVATIKILGFVFYEYDFYPSLKYIMQMG
jgi:hypothetical protein